jgi:hypothetical protein
MAADGGILMRHGAVGFALMVLAFASANLTPVAAESGSAGGSIGNDDKTVSGAETVAREQSLIKPCNPVTPGCRNGRKTVEGQMADLPLALPRGIEPLFQP